MKLGIGDALGEQEFARLFEHTRRQIGDYNPGYVGCDGEGGVPTTGGDIERLLLGVPLAQLNQPLQVVACTMREAGDVALCRTREVVLHLRFLFVAILGCLCH